MAEIYAFACWHKSRDESTATIINSTTRSKARYQYFLDISDVWSEVKIMDIKVRKVGAPHSSERFIANAKYRGLPDVRCGRRVRVKDTGEGDDIGEGVIVGHNSSANFDVLFESGRFTGQVLNVHPCGLELLPASAPPQEGSRG